MKAFTPSRTLLISHWHATCVYATQLKRNRPLDVNILTIGNMLGRQENPVRVVPKPDTPATDARFSPALEQSQAPREPRGMATHRHTRTDDPREPTAEQRKDFREFIDKRTKPRKPESGVDHRREKPQDTKSARPDQSDPVQAAVAQGPVVVEHRKQAAAAAGVPKAPENLAQMIEGAKATETIPTASQTPKSMQVKLPASGKNHSGADAVTADALKHGTANASAKQTDSSDKLQAAPNLTPDAQSITEPANPEQLTLAASITDAAGTTTGKGQSAASDSLLAVEAETKATDTTSLADTLTSDGTEQTKKLGEVTAETNGHEAEPLPTDGQPGVIPAQTQQNALPKAEPVAPGSQHSTVKAEEPLPTTEAETETDTAVQQTPTRPISTPGKTTCNTGGTTQNSTPEAVKGQSGTADAGNNPRSDSPGSSLINSGRILSQSTAQTSGSEQAPMFAVQTEPATSPRQPEIPVGERLGTIGNQVLEAVRTSISQQTGDREITIQLHPPELGKVSVRFQEQGAEITGTLEVSKAQTRTEIEQVLPEMIRALADSGVAIKRIDVVLSQNEQSNQHGSRDPLLHDGPYQQRDSANPGQSGNEQQTTQTYYGPTGRSAYQYQTAAELHDMLVTNTSIDMLV